MNFSVEKSSLHNEGLYCIICTVGAINSKVECHLDVVKAIGSSPISPTILS